MQKSGAYFKLCVLEAVGDLSTPPATRQRTFQPSIFHLIEPPHALLVVQGLLVWSIDAHLATDIQVPLLQSVTQRCLYLQQNNYYNKYF